MKRIIALALVGTLFMLGQGLVTATTVKADLYSAIEPFTPTSLFFKFSGTSRSIPDDPNDPTGAQTTEVVFVLTSLYAGTSGAPPSVEIEFDDFVYAGISGLSTDGVIFNTAGSAEIFQEGGVLNLYETTDFLVPSDVLDVQPLFTGYTSSLTASLEPQTIFDLDGNAYADTTIYNIITNPDATGSVQGDGQGWASVNLAALNTPLAQLLNTNGQEMPDGTFADFYFDFSFTSPQEPGFVGDTQIDDPILGAAAVPEPMSMLLFGTGLVGLAGVARRKIRK